MPSSKGLFLLSLYTILASFVLRHVLWNSLLNYVVDAHSVTQLKSRLDKFRADQKRLLDWTANMH